jgi:hypothetical protein
VKEVALDVYGLRARLRGWPEVVESLRLDFAWFEAAAGDATPQVEVVAKRREPDWDALGPGVASFVTPRNVVYQQNGRTIVDYFGRAVSVLEGTDPARLSVQGEDEHLVHEAAYHFLTSRAGAHLDSVGLPRLHALALSGAHGAVALMLPSGGGKSTMALRALREDGVKLLSEDTALMDRRGRLHPFPLRIGVNASDAERLPPGTVRRLERMEFHPKLALEIDAFRESIDDQPRPLRHLVIGLRSLGRDAVLEPVSRRSALMPLLREAVVGVGVYQGMEFLLQRGLSDAVGLMPVWLTRARCSAAALSGARVWRLTTGRDHERNWAALRPLLERP